MEHGKKPHKPGATVGKALSKAFGLRKIKAIRRLKRVRNVQYVRLMEEFNESLAGQPLAEEVKSSFKEFKDLKERADSDLISYKYAESVDSKYAAYVGAQVRYFTKFLDFAEKKARREPVFKSTVALIRREKVWFKAARFMV
jgi:hypothetical protein